MNRHSCLSVRKAWGKTGSESFAVCTWWYSSPVLGCDPGWWLLGTKWFTPLQGPKGMTAGKKKIQLQMSSCGESRLHEVFQPAHAGCQAWPVALCPTSARASPCPFPCFVPCFFYMIYVSGWWIERLPWLCWSQGQLHLPSSASKPDCGWNTSRCYNFKFSFRLINALMVIAVDL